MSFDYVFSSSIHSSKDKGASHAPCAQLWHFLYVKCRMQWVVGPMFARKYATPWASAALANCLNLS